MTLVWTRATGKVDVRTMHDDMFFTADERSLRRGRRAARRTPTCRPCLVWPQDAPDLRIQGVVMDVNPYGMLIRMLEPFAIGTDVFIQLMRDEDFEQPLAAPLAGTVMRLASTPDGFSDLGVQLAQKVIASYKAKPIRLERRRLAPVRRTRMHTIDYTVGERRGRRTER